MEIVTRQEAQEKGWTRYFTGEPCIHGHVAERFTTSRWCAQCASDKHAAKRKKFRKIEARTEHPDPSYIVKRQFKEMKQYARARARKGGLEYTLTDRDWDTLITRSQGHCELTGIPFQYEATEFFRRPFAPSIDRIDSNAGYTPDNVRLVVYAVNAAMNEWGQEVFEQVASAYLSRKAA